MRRGHFLSLLAATALLGAGLAAGTLPASGDVTVTVPGGPALTVPLPGTPNVTVPTPTPPLPACLNTKDDDGDGKADFPADAGCESPVDTDETDAATAPGKGKASDPAREGEHSTGGRGSERPAVGKRSHGRRPNRAPSIRRPDGAPTKDNPTLSDVIPGPTPMGVPNFMIDRFRIPPFLLPIYQAAGIQYGVRWEVLAAINEIETDYGRNLNVSSAGAVGWMQFMPATWKAYGVDANADRRKDPYNPVDAIFAAARYLRAAGAQKDLRRAIFAYNHADWYVDSVVLRARLISGVPGDLIGSLSGLTQGRFPIAAPARYADDLSEREAIKRAKKGTNAARIIAGQATRRGINVYARRNSPVVAVNDGVVKRVGESRRLGRYVVLQDAYGNSYTYSHLGRVARVYPVPKQHKLTAEDFQLVKPKRDARPTLQASDAGTAKAPLRGPKVVSRGGPVNTEDLKERLYALPERPSNVDRADLTGQLDDLLAARIPGYSTFSAYFSKVFKFDRKTMVMKPLKPGSRVVAGTMLGRVGKTQQGVAPHLHFAIRPAGKGAPRIDPKPILDGWKLLENTAIYRAAGKNPFFGPNARQPSVGQILLMSKTALERRVLADPRVEIYSCGRDDIRAGRIDRRVLASLAFLAENGFRPTVTSLECGHSVYTTTGNVSHHASGNAADISKINGIPILGHQGKGSLTEYVVKRLLQLQGTMRPAQIITLMRLGGPTYAMGDHADHIHLGFRPLYGSNAKLGKQLALILKPEQWSRLIDRLGEIQNPQVPVKPSRYSIPVPRAERRKRASDAHVGE